MSRSILEKYELSPLNIKVEEEWAKIHCEECKQEGDGSDIKATEWFLEHYSSTGHKQYRFWAGTLIEIVKEHFPENEKLV